MQPRCPGQKAAPPAPLGPGGGRLPGAETKGLAAGERGGRSRHLPGHNRVQVVKNDGEGAPGGWAGDLHDLVVF